MQPGGPLESSQPSIPALQSVAEYLGPFGPDQQGFIRDMLPRAQLNTGLIDRFVQIEEVLQNTHNPTLGRQFEDAKSEFIKHIQHRIKELKTARALDNTPQQNNGLRLNLENACRHIQDVLCATKIAFKHHLETVSTVRDGQADEIRHLRKTILRSFEACLAAKNAIPSDEAHKILHPLRARLFTLERLARADKPSIQAIQEESKKIEELATQIFSP